MATFTSFDDLQGAEFVDANLQGAKFVDASLHGARFRRADLSDVVMRAIHVQGMDIEAPFLFDRESFLRVNGVDVVPLVEAELNRRFPGRADRGATDPDGLRAAWAALERTWTEQPYHPIGEPNAEYETDGNDISVFATLTPPYADVLEVRAGGAPPLRRPRSRRD